METLLGIDCGLTRVKAVVFDRAGGRLAQSSRPTPLQGERMDGEALWRAVALCVREALARAGSPAIAAVGLSGHGNGLYALDAEGREVRAFSSMFSQNQAAVKALAASPVHERLRALTRQSVWGGQPLQILAWLKRSDRPAYDRVATVLLCKDFVRHRLTGRLATDFSDAGAAALLADEGAELYGLLGLSEKRDCLPEVLPCFARAGQVSRAAAEETGLAEGTPVAAGLFDVNACMLGGGVLDDRTCSVTAGTWAIAATPVPRPVDSRDLTQCCPFVDRDRWMAVVSGPTSCVNLDWFLRALRPELALEEANAVAEAFDPGAPVPLYLPYLYRDLAKPGLSGAFLGLAPEHTWRDLLRAVYEGVAFAHRLQLDRLARAGLDREALVLSGGAANAPLWRQLFADVLGKPVIVTREREAGALGAAMAAAVCAGLYPRVEDAAKAMVRREALVRPRPHPAYEAKYERFLQKVGERDWTWD